MQKSLGRDKNLDEQLKVRLDMWQLEIFCVVAELKSFSRAAEALFLSQPTVTSHISALEKRVGVKLFDRTTRRVTLTPEGKLLYRHAKALLSEHEQTLQELSLFRGGLAGTLVFGASTIPGQYILPALLAKFHQQFPAVQMTMRIGGSGRILDGVLTDELELGVIGARPKERNLRAVPLWDDEVVLIVAPTHDWAKRGAVSVHELTQQPFVVREEGSGTRATLERFLTQHNLSLRKFPIAAEVGSTEAVKHFVAASHCVGAVSIRAIECETDQKRLAVVRLKEGHITRRFYGIVLTDRTPSPVCRTFLRFLKESATGG